MEEDTFILKLTGKYLGVKGHKVSNFKWVRKNAYTWEGENDKANGKM